MRLLVFSYLLLYCAYALCQEEEATSFLSDDGQQLESRNYDDRLEKLKTAGFALAKSLTAILGVSNPFTATALTVGIEIFQPIIEAISGGEQDIWAQIENQVDDRIGEKLSTSKISSYKDLLFDFNKRMQKGKKFAQADLDFIIGKMEAVIPFDTSLGWDYELPLMMVHYIPYLIASYQEIMKKDEELPVCQLANDMNLFRSKVILGCKEMMKKRYKLIHSESWDKFSTNCKKRNLKEIFNRENENDRSKGERSKRGVALFVNCKLYQMIYKDAATDKLIKVGKVNGKHHGGKSWEYVINTEIRKPTVAFLYKNVIEKINKYFTDDICLKTQFKCECPKPIKKEEINFGWPKGCFGKDTCMFPAGNFGKDYTWCYEKGVGTTWDKSDRYDLDMCMPVNRNSVKPLNVIRRDK